MDKINQQQLQQARMLLNKQMKADLEGINEIVQSQRNAQLRLKQLSKDILELTKDIPRPKK